jgi:hypothetical protein
MSAKAGEMHPVDKAFYDLTVKERNYERVRADRFERERDALHTQLIEARKHWEEQLLGDEAVRALARQRFDYLSGYRGQRWEEAHESIRREEEGRARTFLETALEARRSTRAAIDATKGGEG